LEAGPDGIAASDLAMPSKDPSAKLTIKSLRRLPGERKRDSCGPDT